MVEVRIKFLSHFDKSFGPPSYESHGSAGADLKACLDGEKIIISPKERVLVPTGISVEIPAGFEWQIRPRSGLSLKTGLLVPNAPGTIDSDYRGEIKVILGNFGDTPITINHGDRIAQAVLARYEQAHFVESEQLAETSRGSGGFGSTGRE